jgi:hypothetical protein
MKGKSYGPMRDYLDNMLFCILLINEPQFGSVTLKEKSVVRNKTTRVIQRDQQ